MLLLADIATHVFGRDTAELMKVVDQGMNDVGNLGNVTAFTPDQDLVAS